MRGDSISEYVKKHKLLWATAGPGDFLFMPAHYLLYEAVQDSNDVLGLRAGLIVPRGAKGYNLFDEEAKLSSTADGAVCKLVVKTASLGRQL